MVEMIALLSIFLSSLLYGRDILLLAVLPQWPGWLLNLAAALMPLMLFEPWLVGYWPNDSLLPITLAWAVLGACLLISPHPEALRPPALDVR